MNTKVFFMLVDKLYKASFSSWVPIPFSLVKNTRIVKLVDLLALRTYFIDEHVKTTHDCSGVEQMVILGAGLDARGYRLKEYKGKVGNLGQQNFTSGGMINYSNLYSFFFFFFFFSFSC